MTISVVPRWLISLLLVIAGAYSAHTVEPAKIDDTRLYPGDLLKVEIYDNLDLTSAIRVPATGVTTFPLIGDLGQLVGRSIQDLRSEIERRLQDGYLTQAVVTITLQEAGPRTAYVLGAVQRPDSVALNPYSPVTALQAISRAGGFADEANRTGARVLRTDARGQRTAIPVPTEEDVAAKADIILQPGDLVIVPRLDRVFVLGQVKKPGAISIPAEEKLTIAKAISLSGGFDKYSRQDQVQIIRPGASVMLVDVQAILQGKENGPADVALLPGDTVFVPETRF